MLSYWAGVVGCHWIKLLAPGSSGRMLLAKPLRPCSEERNKQVWKGTQFTSRPKYSRARPRLRRLSAYPGPVPGPPTLILIVGAIRLWVVPSLHLQAVCSDFLLRLLFPMVCVPVLPRRPGVSTGGSLHIDRFLRATSLLHTACSAFVWW